MHLDGRILRMIWPPLEFFGGSQEIPGAQGGKWGRVGGVGGVLIRHHVLRISDQWGNRARREESTFRTTVTPECKDYPMLKSFPYPVQKLIVDQYKKEAEAIENDEKPADEMSDVLICFVSYLFYRQYQLSCRHLWQYNILFNSFEARHWDQ